MVHSQIIDDSTQQMENSTIRVSHGFTGSNDNTPDMIFEYLITDNSMMKDTYPTKLSSLEDR